MRALASVSCFARKLSQLLRSGFGMNPAQVPERLKKIFVIKAVWI
jgi:hypothetical protein